MILFVEERAIVAVGLSVYVQADYLVPVVHNVDLFTFDYCWRSDACIGPILIASIVCKLGSYVLPEKRSVSFRKTIESSVISLVAWVAGLVVGKCVLGN